jgi:predicted site-specific integrase-resolvase
MDGVSISVVRVSPTGMMTRKNASIALGVKPKTMCEWAAKGLGPIPVKVGGRIFYHWEHVQSFAMHGQTQFTAT